MLVSIIIPNYNHARFLTQRIETVLHQTCQDFEVIILDDASTDDSREIIERYSGHPKIAHIAYNTQNSGSVFKQWQKGIDLAKGQYIWIAESDDYADPGFLSENLKLFANNAEDVGIAYCKSLPVDQNSYVYDDSDWWMKRVDAEKWENDYVNSGLDEVSNCLSVQCTIPNASAVLFDARCFNEIEWSQVNFKICGDWYVYVTILKKYNIAYKALPLNYHRNHQWNARSRYAGQSILEQYRVLDYIHENFTVTKSKFYNKALDERLASLLTALKNTNISKKIFLEVIALMRRFDKRYLSRLFRVCYGKLRHVDFSFK